jgi:hypothetical protein
VLAVVVVGLTLATGSSRAALVAHATGLTVGLVAGRLGVLDISRDRGSDSDRRDGSGRGSQQAVDLERD